MLCSFKLSLLVFVLLLLLYYKTLYRKSRDDSSIGLESCDENGSWYGEVFGSNGYVYHIFYFWNEMLIRVTGLLLLVLGVSRAQVAPRHERVDCLPIPGASKESCMNYGCWWDNVYDETDPTVPLCYYPVGQGGYETTSTGKILTLTKRSDGPKNPFGTDISPIYLSTAQIGATLNIKIGTTDRYEIPPPIRIPKEKSVSSDGLSFETVSQSPFSFRIRRKSTQDILWDTSIGGLIFSDKYIQIATYLPSTEVYGFGENIHEQLKHDFSKYTTWGMFARDEPPDSKWNDRKNLYGVHPFYLCLEGDGKAHGVLIWNSNAQEVTMGPSPHLVYRTIGGLLDMYFFPGPTAEEVIKQYLALIGRPMLPAYFALGFQLCRYGYKDLQEMKDAVTRVQGYGIPLDIPYADIDYMNRYKDFTTGSVWSDFGNYAKKLHDDGLHLFLIFDPAIQVDYDTYSRGVSMGASFLEWERMDQVPKEINGMYPLTANSKVMLGVVWPDKHVAFPDFMDTTNKTQDWWINEFKLYHDQVAFDGLWIDMNEPSNFGTNQDHPWYYDNDDHPNIKPLFCPLSGADSTWDMPPFQTQAVYYFNGGDGSYLSTNTMCMLAQTGRGSQRLYNTKNLYGLSEAMATQAALWASTGKRGAIISRSTFPSSGHFAGHWLGDNTARWEDLQTSVIGAQEFNIFGIPYVGSDICGFIGTTTEELCLRWQQMGAFHPFSRNHNTIGAPPQDPGMWPSVAAAAKTANLFRYRHLPYLYSLHFEASLNGGTVIRPLFFEFPTDTATHNLGHQFLWGSGMMIIPVVEEGVSQVTGYLPKAHWYSLREEEYGLLYNPGSNRFPAAKTQLIPVLARGGVIIPRQGPSTTTTASRKNPFELLIAMDYDFATGAVQKSSGKMYWDDGESIITDYSTANYFCWEFEYTATDATATLTIKPVRTATGLTMPTLDVIEIVGYNYNMGETSIGVNGVNTPVTVTKGANNVLTLSKTGFINLGSQQSFTLTWAHTTK